MHSTALFTDLYELTMLEAALRDGTAHRPCVFEVFARRLPEGRRFGVVAGLDRLIDAIAAFRFGDEELGFLAEATPLSDATLDWLSSYRFTGDVVAYPEGELHVADSPVLTVVAPFAEATVLETLVLSVLNYDSAVAAAAARMVAAADGRRLLEFGSRRAHEHAAIAAARASYLVGFDGTSNLEASRRYGIPVFGTSAHSYTLLHDEEPEAFTGQVAALGSGTTLLVDTYDTRAGLERALAAAGTGLGGVRIDSGDLAADARFARDFLDEHGAEEARIVLSGNLDEHKLAALRDAPADAYGVGTSVVTGSGAPTAEFVYKLVARAPRPGAPFEPVSKAGGEKATIGGRKAAWRRRTGGVADAEILRPWESPPPDGDVRPLQVTVIRDGEVVHRPGLDEIRAHHRTAIAELDTEALAVTPGEPALTLIEELPGAGASQPSSEEVLT